MQTISSSVSFGDQVLEWSEWTELGGPWGPVIAIDTETTRIVGRSTVPRLCLVSASDGSQHVVIRPDDTERWINRVLKPSTRLIFHNAAFDFWVLDKHLALTKGSRARDVLWTAVDEGRVHDTMLLEMLVSLARSDAAKERKLADLSESELGVPLPKDRYRDEFGHLLVTPWEAVDPGFFEYAIRDAVATWRVYEKLEREARAICSQHGLADRHGLLTEAIQVRGAISLHRISQLGMHIDQGCVSDLKRKWDAELEQLVLELERLAVHGNSGQIVRRQRGKTSTGERVSINQKALRQHLDGVSKANNLSVPRTASGEVSLSIKHSWIAHLGVDPLLAAWSKYISLKKLYSFLADLDQPRIHPRYYTLVRSGRTSCKSPNIQQFPRTSPVREAITAGPGCVLLIIDYTCLELRTLAAVCFDLFGHSRLRDVLIAGVDPHSYTAALFAGMTVEQFGELPEDERKERRQRAKAFNFGIPGGLGAKAFVEHARVAYGVTITLEDAELFIEKLTATVYPELGLYLKEDPAKLLAPALGVSLLQLTAMWSKPSHLGAVRKILRGHPFRADGTPYSDCFVERVWMELRSLCKKPELIPFIERRDVSPDSPLQSLFAAFARTVTGRIRGPVGFTQARNTPFQGLAADGCKEVLWRLTKRGHRVVAFVHDEFVVEVPVCDDYRAVVGRVVQDCKEGMAPFIPGIPVECEYAIAHRWYKAAKAVYDAEGRLVPWVPKNPGRAMGQGGDVEGSPVAGGPRGDHHEGFQHG